jgi:hypothetical protein
MVFDDDDIRMIRRRMEEIGYRPMRPARCIRAFMLVICTKRGGAAYYLYLMCAKQREVLRRARLKALDWRR